MKCMYDVRERVPHHNKRNINRNEKLRILSQAIVWMDFFLLLLSIYVFMISFGLNGSLFYCCKPYAIWLMPCTINHLAMNHICKMREYINNHHHRRCRSILVVRILAFLYFVNCGNAKLQYEKPIRAECVHFVDFFFGVECSWWNSLGNQVTSY